MDKFFDITNIIPGDIILSKGRTLKSTVIRLSTGSIHSSHAAIAINPFIWFEAIGSGTQYNIINPDLFVVNGKYKLGIQIKDGIEYSLWRPRGWRHIIKYANINEIAKDLIDTTGSLAFYNYATLYQLLSVSRIPLEGNPLLKIITQMGSRNDCDKFEGYFCSELVAECYRIMGIDLFDKPSNKITPGYIERSNLFDNVSQKFSGEKKILENKNLNKLNETIDLGKSMLSGMLTNASISKNLYTLNFNINKYVENSLCDIKDKDIIKAGEIYLNQNEKNFDDVVKDFEATQKQAKKILKNIYPWSVFWFSRFCNDYNIEIKIPSSDSNLSSIFPDWNHIPR